MMTRTTTMAIGTYLGLGGLCLKVTYKCIPLFSQNYSRATAYYSRVISTKIEINYIMYSTFKFGR